QQGAAGVSLTAPIAGRVNLLAARDGLFEIAPDLVGALNALDESLTVATLAAPCWVPERRMLATVKVIPYAAPETALNAAETLAAAARERGPRVHAATRPSVSLILTETPGLAPALLQKGAAAIRARLLALAAPLVEERVVPHRIEALADALGAAQGDLILVLAATATTDRRDVTPAAIEAAGGAVERLGMPVDPGNLLALGALGARQVVGLPGCARSPKLNGADWVLERLCAGRAPDAAEIAAMGFGGLLKEISARPAPRLGASAAAARSGDPGPRIAGVLLAAGGARRMGASGHKLLQEIDGAPQIRRAAEALSQAKLSERLVVLGAESDAMAAALAGLDLRRIENPSWRSGMAGSLRAGVLALSPQTDAVIVALADMPLMDAALIDRLAAAFDPDEGREIVRPLGADGAPGHPILFGRRFFEALSGLTGDEGARSVIREHPEFLAEIAIGGEAPLLDLDTPEAWAAFRAALSA
ncbi:MAG: NTP transferase domain-containing protein, partial [Pseudomonadota bacterium]